MQRRDFCRRIAATAVESEPWQSRKPFRLPPLRMRNQPCATSPRFNHLQAAFHRAEDDSESRTHAVTVGTGCGFRSPEHPKSP